MSKRHATSYMNYNTFDVVNSCAFKTIHFELSGVGNPITKFLVLIRLLIKLESLEMGEQNLRTRLYLDLLSSYLLS